MKYIRRYLECLIILLVSVLSGCRGQQYILTSAEDLDGSQIAVLNHSVSDIHLEQVFPESDIIHFKSSSEFLLALAVGKCDAGIAERQEGEYLLNRNPDGKALCA